MKLLHHPNIVRIFEVIGTKTKIYIVMEYVTGGPLSDKLVRIFQEIKCFLWLWFFGYDEE